ncbi:hypothetical protein H4R18_000158 [Coemansia javaensis]|uniref:HSF-type DNA-binding domain-containing protein n=1 Tax=Coemansia javaensis TaxID=2761396 RepID=A0A9W8LNB1_9FUNG|nr:hypothetical protein H4R18_000158 [Coemansia javaensis]
MVIADEDAVEREVLPNHFSRPSFNSFTRQLYHYGLRRTTDNRRERRPGGYCEFENPHFKRGRRDLVRKVRRVQTPRRTVAMSITQRIQQNSLRDYAADAPQTAAAAWARSLDVVSVSAGYR